MSTCDSDIGSSSGESEPEDGDTIFSEERSEDESLNSTDRGFLESDDDNSRSSDLVRLARTIGEGFGQIRPQSRRIRLNDSSDEETETTTNQEIDNNHQHNGRTTRNPPEQPVADEPLHNLS